MADGSDGTDASPESEATATAAEDKGGEIWGTLEELLLACAVTRHGTASWDSVAMEVKTRSPLAARPGLTPHSCRLRFRHLHRRFSPAAGSGGEEEVVEVDPDASAAEGWVDELRRLRVAELRRDVERCDLSIGTLQSKVKRLREERERSVSAGEEKPDEASGNDRLSGEEPGRSCRESNSTDLKPPKHPSHQGGGAKEEEVAKQEASGESAAASKESSDVRSSASLCRRRRGTGGGKADEEEEAASAPRAPAARSPPLAALLDAVAAKLGSVLQGLHEHEGEEAAAYRGTIRRHVDLETVRRRLDASAGSRAGDDDHYPAHELYRDLLLLCTNAVVFFPRSAPEHAAAAEARALVTGHAATALREPKPERSAAPVTALAGTDIVGSLIQKQVKPLIVCRKRSSIAKAAAAARKEESTAAKAEAAVAEEEEDSEDEKKVAAATRDKVRGLRTKKGRGGAVRNPSGLGLRPAKGANGDAAAATDGAKKGAAAGGPPKKRKAVDFLKRLNQAPSRKRGSQLGTTRKRSVAAEPEITITRKRGAGRKEGAGRGGGSRRGGRGTGNKRGVGRPLKRGAAPATLPPSKRAKTNARSEKPSGTGKRGGRRQAG
ncbi:unnamed protein product [Urochloa humidicola]